MRVVRHGVFETNSSSVHSLSIMTQEKFSKWDNSNFMKDGETYTFDEGKEMLMADADFLRWYGEESKEYDEETWNDMFREYEFYTKEDFGGDYETFEEKFTTPSGDKMVAFGFFGRDG
jgi:hypothetical protein